MNKQNKENFKEVEKAFRQLSYVFSSISFGQYFNNLYDLCLSEERRHRKSCPASCTPEKVGISASDASKYFAVKFLLDYSDGHYTPTIKDVLHLKPSCVMCATLVANYQEEIKKAFAGVAIPGKADIIDPAKIKALDYVELMKA